MVRFSLAERGSKFNPPGHLAAVSEIQVGGWGDDRRSQARIPAGVLLWAVVLGQWLRPAPPGKVPMKLAVSTGAPLGA